jgi:hypothetical protein
MIAAKGLVARIENQPHASLISHGEYRRGAGLGGPELGLSPLNLWLAINPNVSRLQISKMNFFNRMRQILKLQIFGNFPRSATTDADLAAAKILKLGIELLLKNFHAHIRNIGSSQNPYI